MKLNQLTLKQTLQGLQNQDFTSEEVTNDCLEHISSTDEKIKSYIKVTRDEALLAAKKVDKAGNFEKLNGVPVGIKDLFCTKGITTTAASKILQNYVPPFSATAVEMLGTDPVILGKLNLDEFACGSSTETSFFGSSKNPWDVSRVPGGSSGGSAAAVAADQCIYSLGTDTGGSIRQPAALCGCVGLKPTYGRVSRYGVVAMASSLDQVGPITKTVEDAAIVMNHIAGHDAKDSTSVSLAVPDFTALLGKEIKGMKIGLPKEYFGEGLKDDVKKAVEAGIEKLKDLGAQISEVSLPYSKYGLAVYYIIMPSELSSNLARYDGVRFGYSADADNLLDNYMQSRGEGFGAEIRRRVMLGTYALSSGYYDAYYKKALQVRTLVTKDFERVFETVDLIVTPTTPSVAFKFGEKTNNPLEMYLSDIFTVSANIAGLPGISVPCGFSQPDGGETEMPIGLQLIGPAFSEERILQAAYQYEQATDWHSRKPQL